jgi:hypothetical protein
MVTDGTKVAAMRWIVFFGNRRIGPAREARKVKALYLLQPMTGAPPMTLLRESRS